MEKEIKNKEIISLLREIIKKALEEMMIEEREEYLRNHRETKGNGYYTRDLMTGVVSIDALRVPRTRDGNFRSGDLP